LVAGGLYVVFEDKKRLPRYRTSDPLELGRNQFRTIQVGLGDSNEMRFRNPMPKVVSVLLAHRADPNHSHSQLCHDGPGARRRAIDI
jgi:hypothetical protein